MKRCFSLDRPNLRMTDLLPLARKFHFHWYVLLGVLCSSKDNPCPSSIQSSHEQLQARGCAHQSPFLPLGPRALYSWSALLPLEQSGLIAEHMVPAGVPCLGCTHSHHARCKTPVTYVTMLRGWGSLPLTLQSLAWKTLHPLLGSVPDLYPHCTA